MTRRGAQAGRKRRGQSEVLGVILVFALVIAGATTVVLLGAGAIGESQEALGVQRAEKALTQFDSKAALVALDNTDVQSAELVGGSRGTFRAENGTGWMNITVRNTTDSSNDFDLLNQSLGSFEYQQGSDVVAYQGGGVWRSTGNGSTMVSPPEFHFRNGTLTLPIINVTGGSGPAGRASISHRETARLFPDGSLADGDNPLDQHKVTIVVRSEFYDAWGRYFAERTDGVVAYDHQQQKAILTLKTPAGQRKVSNAIAATAASGTLSMSGSGSAPARTDSYNSSVGPYSPGNDDGNISLAGDVELTGNAEVWGDIHAGGWVDCGNNNDVFGRIHYTDAGSTTISCGPMDGSEQIGGLEGVSPVNEHVTDTVDSLSADNDNQAAGADIDTNGDTLDFSGGTATLPPGDYYLSDLTVDDRTLELDTNGETIRIGVRDYVDIEGDATIDVKGDGEVKIYVKGEATESDGFHFDMRNQGSDVPEVSTPGTVQNSTQLWIYGRADMQAAIDGSGVGQRPEFQGVIYAPGGTAGTSSLDLTGQVFGGVVVGSVDVGTGGEVHFDEALEDARAIPKNTKIVTITYLHVTVSQLAVRGG